MKRKIIQMLLFLFLCASARGFVLDSTNDFNYFDSADLGYPEIRSTTNIPGLFQSSHSGVLVKASRPRGGGTLITKSTYFMGGGSAQFIWSGSGGDSYMQSVFGTETQPWPTDTNNAESVMIITEFGNLYASSWLATPGTIYATTVTFTETSYSFVTVNSATGQVEGTGGGSCDFTAPVYIYFRTGDTYDNVDAYMLLQSLTLYRPLASLSIAQQPTNQTANVGGDASFTAIPTGIASPTYQWQFNGQNILNATNATLTVTSVTAANSGSYSVTVSNSYGFVTNAATSLAVLDDGANGNTPIQIIAPSLPSIPNGTKELIVITHGWERDGPAADISWVSDLQSAILQHVGSDCSVTPYYWVGSTPGQGAWTLFPWQALDHAKILGTLLGKQIGNNFQKIHLIGHSAGAGLIQAAANAIRLASPSTIIQETFLDPYTGQSLEGRNEYGANANWADDYFVIDFTDDIDLPFLQDPDSTSGQLEWAFNVDVSGTIQGSQPVPFFTSSGIADSTSSVVYSVPSPTHGSPIDFYLSTIIGTAPSCATGYGFPLSIEAGGSGNWAADSLNNSPLPLCGILSLSQNQQPVQSNPLFDFSLLPNATSDSGVNFTDDNGAILSSSSSSQASASSGKVHPLDDPTGSPAWLAIGASVTNTVNFVQFDAEFIDTNAAQGLLTIYWNTNQIGMVDERVTTQLQTYRFALTSPAMNGTYTLSFRLDSFDGSSSIIVTNVLTGYVGLSQPITLGISITNGAPLLQVTAATNFTYLIQSSINMVDWTPTALLFNLNGQAQFIDSATTNSATRFYRAMMP